MRRSTAVLILALVVCAWPSGAPCQGNANGPGTGDINLNNNNATNQNSQGSYNTSNQNGHASPGSALTAITRPEAEAMLAPPVPIVNVSNPATVFNSGDECVRAAVQDWLSKIKVPHDKYGNVLNAGYVNAFCPDKLPPGLLEHIVTYTQGRRMIAVSAAHALSLAQAQQQFREEIIKSIIRNGRPGNTNGGGGGAASANTNGSGNGNAAANSNGNGNGGGAGAGGNGNTGGGGENVPNLNNNNATSNGNGNGNGNSSGGLTWDKDVGPIIKLRCVRCHGAAKPPLETKAQVVACKTGVIAATQGCSMPPSGVPEAAMTSEERQKVVDWLRSQ